MHEKWDSDRKSSKNATCMISSLKLNDTAVTARYPTSPQKVMSVILAVSTRGPEIARFILVAKVLSSLHTPLQTIQQDLGSHQPSSKWDELLNSAQMSAA